MKRYLFMLFIFTFFLFGFTLSLYALSADEFLEKVKFTGKPVAKKGNPAEGKENYAMFCTNCHGEKGEGNGPVASVAKMDPKPKNKTEEKKKKKRKEEIFFKFKKKIFPFFFLLFFSLLYVFWV